MPPPQEESVPAFVRARRVAVVGASRDRGKFGNRVLRAWRDAGREVHAVHPREDEIEGIACVRRIGDLPTGLDILSIITPPAIAEDVVARAAAHGIPRLWFQPGASTPDAVEDARRRGLAVLADGPCVLVELRDA